MCNFKKKERIIAKYIIENPLYISELSIHTMAQKIGVSQGLIIHFCKQLGFSGYRDLKIVFSELTPEFLDFSLDDNVSPPETVKRVFGNAIKVIEDTLLILDYSAFNTAAEALVKSERIDFYARGGSARIAENAARKFVRWGSYVSFYRDAHQQQLSASNLQPGSVAIGVTYSGETSEVIDCLETARNNGAMTIVITSCEGSSAAKFGDVVLLSAIRGAEMFGENEFTKIAQIVVLDALYFYFIKKFQ